jgi:type IV secretion system protein VirB4
MMNTQDTVKKRPSFRKEASVSDKYIQYSYHLTDHVISMKSGDLVSVFMIDGRTHDCASDSELINWHKDLNTLVKTVGTDQVEIWSHEHHHESTEYPEGKFSKTFPKLFDKYYRKILGDKKQLVTDLYLTVVYKQIGDKAQKFLSKFERPSKDDIQRMQDDALESIEDISDQLMESMKPYGIQRLGIYYRDSKGEEITSLSESEKAELLKVNKFDLFDEQVSIEEETTDFKNQHAFSKALEFLSFLCNMEWSLVPVCRDRISTYLMQNRTVSPVWGDVIQVRTIDHDFYTTAIEIRDYEKETEPGALNLIKESDFEYLLTQSFSCIAESSAMTLLSHQEASLNETKDRGVSQILELGEAMDQLKARSFVMGYHHATVHVWDRSQHEVQRKARKMKVMMQQCGIVAGNVGLASEAAYFAKLPGNQQWAPRPVPINSWNFLHFSPFHNFLRGKPDQNPWGPAMTLYRSVSGSPIYMSPHVTPLGINSFRKRPPGHILMTGMTGEGKTTQLNAILAQATKFNPRIIAFDRDQGMQPFICSVGGEYRVLRQGMSSGFSPAQIEPTFRNIAMVKRLLTVCVEQTNNGPVENPESAVNLSEAVDAVMGPESQVPRESRDISQIYGYVTDEKMRVLLHEWTRQGEHGWLFDNPKDVLDLNENDYFGFDLTEFLVAEDEVQPPTRTPLLMYLMSRVRDAIDGTRHFMQVFDEFHAYLDDPVLVRDIKRGIKTDRKKDCIYVFATQEPNDALASKIGRTVMSQTPTKFCLRDPEGVRGDYRFLSDAEFNALKSIPENSRQFLLKQGQKSALATFNLYPPSRSDADIEVFDRIISVLSGEPQNAEIVESLVAKHGNNPDAWLPEYWQTVA